MASYEDFSAKAANSSVLEATTHRLEEGLSKLDTLLAALSDRLHPILQPKETLAISGNDEVNAAPESDRSLVAPLLIDLNTATITVTGMQLYIEDLLKRLVV